MTTATITIKIREEDTPTPDEIRRVNDVLERMMLHATSADRSALRLLIRKFALLDESIQYALVQAMQPHTDTVKLPKLKIDHE